MDIDLSKNSVMLSCYPHRVAFAQRVFEARGLALPRILPGWIVPKSHHRGYPAAYSGIALGFIEAMFQAERANLPYLVFFEDDALPCIHVQQRLDAILTAHPLPEDCGLLCLGDSNGTCRSKRTLPLCECGDPYTLLEPEKAENRGSHAFVIFAGSYIPYIQAVIDCGVSDMGFARLQWYSGKKGYALFRTPLFAQPARPQPGSSWKPFIRPEAYIGREEALLQDFPEIPEALALK